MIKCHSVCSYSPVFYFHHLPSLVGLLEESIVAQLTYMKFQSSLLYSQRLATKTYPEPREFSLHPQTL